MGDIWKSGIKYTGGGGASSLPSGGTTGQVLVKKSDKSRDVEWKDEHSVDAQEIKDALGYTPANKVDVAKKYEKPPGGIPESDLAAEVVSGINDHSDPEAVKFVDQSLSDEQKGQARENIAAENVGHKKADLSAYSTDEDYPTAKCVYDKTSGLDKELGNGTVPKLELERGSISSDTGGNQAGNNRIRTINFISADGIRVEATSGKAFVFGYRDDESYVGSSRGWIEGNRDISVDGAKKYRISFARTDNSALTVDDFDSLGITITALHKGIVVKTIQQELTDGEKSTARSNIGAYAKPSTGIPKEDIAGDVFLLGNGTDIDENSDGKLQFADRPAQNNGMGYKILRPNADFDKQVTASNTIYEIRYNFVLTKNFQVPFGCVLDFRGGSIDGAYTLDLNDCQIIGTKGWIGEQLKISGKTQSPAMVDWFKGIDALKIERAISTFHVCHLAGRDYSITRPVEINSPFALFGESLPENFGTLSRTQLIATQPINCILNITKGSTFISANIENVALTASSGNYGTVNGINICTPNGPSRPFAIRGCSFKRLKYGIYAYIDGENKSTNIFTLSIIACNMSVNNWAIYASGRHSIGCLEVADSVIEQNTNGALYAYDDNTTIGLGAIEFRNNLLEGQPTPILVRTGGSVTLSGNYFETSGYECHVHIYSAGGIGPAPVQIIGNHHSSNGASLFHYHLYGCDVFRLIDSGTQSYNIHLNSCLVHQGYFRIGNKIAECKRTFFFENDMESDTPLFSFPIVPNFIEDGRPSLNAVRDGINFFYATRDIPAGDYRLVMYVATGSANDAIFIRDNLNGNSFDFALNGHYRNIVLKLVHDIQLVDPISGLNNIGYGCRSDGNAQAMKISSFCFFENDGISIPKLKLSDIGTSGYLLEDLINPKEGISFFYPTYNGIVAKTNSGWVDAEGYTPASRSGATENRPALSTNGDVGFTYFDTSLGKTIVWNGSNWVNMDGTALS